MKSWDVFRPVLFGVLPLRICAEARRTSSQTSDRLMEEAGRLTNMERVES